MNNKGFTLLELIIVIVVLGIIAMTAAPKFIDFSANARTKAMQALVASIDANIHLVHSQAIVAEQIAPVGQLQMDNVSGANNYYRLVYGWPAATGGDGSNGKGFGLAKSLNTHYQSANLRMEILTVNLASIEFINRRAKDKTRCRIIYQQATDTDEPPQITALLSGC